MDSIAVLLHVVDLTVEFETCHPSILLLIIIIIILIIMTAPSSGMVFHAGVALKAGIKYQVPTIWFAWKWELNHFGCTLTMGSSSKCINPPRMLDMGQKVLCVPRLQYKADHAKFSMGPMWSRCGNQVLCAWY